MILVDTSILLDVLKDDPVWGERAQFALDAAMAGDTLIINDIVYAELSVRYPSIEAFERVLAALPLRHVTMPRPALFLAAKAYQRYRRQRGTRTGVLSDFFIGAHAAVEGASLLTRDPSRVRAYFPTVDVITP